MKQVYIINENHPKLLLFFAGWAADETPFKQYHPKDTDYMICYDYRTPDFDTSVFDRYRQINVVAWSMGVWAGSLILSQVPREKIFSIAFNGSTSPIDNLEGIPVQTYQATLDGLTPAFIGSNDRIFPPENLEMNHDNLMCNNVILTDSAHYDASMFRFLLQDMWEMPIDDFMHHLKSINIE
mgnify:CR=1 FL=1